MKTSTTKGKAPKPKIKTGGTTVRLGKTKTANGGAKGCQH